MGAHQTLLRPGAVLRQRRRSSSRGWFELSSILEREPDSLQSYPGASSLEKKTLENTRREEELRIKETEIRSKGNLAYVQYSSLSTSY